MAAARCLIFIPKATGKGGDVPPLVAALEK